MTEGDIDTPSGVLHSTGNKEIRYEVWAPTRDELLHTIDERAPDHPPYLRIVSATCGLVREYLTRGSVPKVSVQCNCGMEPEHWVIRYGEEVNK